MAVVAARHGIDQVAAEPDELPILAPEMQRHGRNLQTAPDSGIVAVTLPVFGMCTQRTSQNPEEHDGSTGRGRIEAIEQTFVGHLNSPEFSWWLAFTRSPL